MKKILFIFILMISNLHFSQDAVNPFEESEKENSSFKSNNEAEKDLAPSPQGKTGNPADPAPIDDYVPLLVLTAIGIIVYIAHKKRNLLP